MQGQSSSHSKSYSLFKKKFNMKKKKYYIMHKENRDVMQNEIYYAKRNKHDKVCKENPTV